MLKFCTFLLGEDYQLLKTNTPKSRKKIYLLATALMIPVMLWTVMGYMIADGILDMGFSIGLIAALFCGLAIFGLERIILMSDGNSFLTFLRILMALVVAMLGAAFIDILVFKNDISQEMDVMKQERKDQMYAINAADLNSRINQQKQTVNAMYGDWQTAQDIMVKEADGTSGTKKGGVGAVTKLKGAVAGAMEQQYLTEKANLENMTSELKRLKSYSDETAEANFNPNSLLLQWEALDRLIEKSAAVKKVFWLFTLLMLFLELLVVIAKYGTDKTAYDRLCETQEEMAKRRQAYLTSDRSTYMQPENLDSGLKMVSKQVAKTRPGLWN